MIPELRKAIYDIGKTITGLSSRFYFVEAPRDVQYPYAVFSQVANTNSRDTASQFEDVFISINYYDKSAAGVEAIAKVGKEKFDDSEALFVPGMIEYHLDRIERVLTRDQKLDDVYMIITQYKLELTKNSAEIPLIDQIILGDTMITNI